MTDHYSTIYRHWLKANWRNIPEEQAQMMHLAGCALESLEMDNKELRKEIAQCRADETANAPSTLFGHHQAR